MRLLRHFLSVANRLPMADYVREEYSWSFVSVKRPELYKLQVMPKRRVVERTIGWMNNFRGYNRQRLQIFIGQSDWDDEAILDKLVKHIANQIGEQDGVLRLGLYYNKTSCG